MQRWRALQTWNEIEMFSALIRTHVAFVFLDVGRPTAKRKDEFDVSLSLSTGDINSVLVGNNQSARSQSIAGDTGSCDTMVFAEMEESQDSVT
jgi:predicted metal-dependent enzyme (double-stranded beta helix superfamily)